MGKEYPTKSFKSGNSVAIRIPSELGIEPGQEFVLVRHGADKFTAIPADRLKENFFALAGAMSPGWMRDGRMDSDSEVRGAGHSRDVAA